MSASTAAAPLGIASVRVAGIATAAGIGYFGWGEHPMALGLSPVLALLWAQAPSRLYAWLVAVAYYLAVTRGMPTGTAVFFGTSASPLIGAGFWVLCGALLALPWALFWSDRAAGYWWRLLAALLAVSVPPLGIFGWGNPLTAAGALFPRTSWLGLLATLALMLAYCYAATSARRARNTLAVHAALALSLLYGGTQPNPKSEARGVDTNLAGVGLGQYDFLATYRNNQRLIAVARQQAADTVLLPESVAGLWLDATATLWTTAQIPRTVFVGAAEPLSGGDYSNVIVAVSPTARGVVYRQRVPVPIGMWHPWSDDSAVAHWRGPGVFYFEGQHYGALLCYEQLLLWPVLQTFAAQPDLVLAPTNAWWSRGTSVPALQKSIVTVWARLFDTPAVTAFNY